MFRAIRLHYAKRHLAKATAEALAYATQPAGQGWNVRMQSALNLKADLAAGRVIRITFE